MAKLTMQDLTSPKMKNAPIYVLNNTVEPNRGPVIFPIERPGTTTQDIIIIPDTWLPVNLIEFAARSQLLESTHLRNVLASRALTLIDQAEADELLASRGADVEQDRLNKHAQAGNGFANSALEEDDEEVALPAKVQKYLQDIDGNDITDIEIVNMFRRSPKLVSAHSKILYKRANNNGRKVLCKYLKATIKSLEV